MQLSLESPTPTPGRHGALDSWREKKEENAPPEREKILVEALN